MASDHTGPAFAGGGLEELNRSILESALDCIVTMDAEGFVREWNPAAERTFGHSRAEAVGRELAALIIPPDLRERHRNGLAHYLRTGEGPVLGRRVEVSAMRADGQQILVELAITAFRHAGVPVFTAYLRDITERVRDERRRQAQYAVASLLAGSGAIEEIIPSIIQTIGQSGNWILGTLWLSEPNDSAFRCHSVWHAPLPRLAKFGAVSRAMVFSNARNLPGRVAEAHEPIWITDVKQDSDFSRAADAAAAGLAGAFAFPLAAGGKVKGVIELFSAVTVQPDEDLLLLVDSLGSQIGHFIERRQVEVELQRQKEMAEAANAAKDRFLATLSHELRTPLTPVLMWAGGMLHDHDLTGDLREGLEMIARNVALEARLIDDLLDLTRIARGQLRLHLQIIDAHEVVRHAVEIVESECPPGLNLELKLGATEHELEADPARLQQVFWNLLRNACKFTPAGGRVSIHSENPEPGSIAITVSDTGAGIAEEDLGRIFNAFEQVGDRQGGLGLGLAISKAIVDVHGGSISVESGGLGRGAKFITRLPAPRRSGERALAKN
ncbi:MAG TPA: ATP-binding protein [Chthoniobacterales bacterium]